MDTHQYDAYGEQIADIYDQWYDSYDEVIITRLAELAGEGRALELGIGTGRIALPLQRKGVEVHGLDASSHMVARLRQKAGGDKIPVTMGNFADVAVEGRFALIYVLFNTFFALLTQEEQVRCFQNVAQRLTPEGVFVIEAFVPDLTRFSGGQALRTVELGQKEARLDASRHDPARQRVSSQHILLTEKGTRFYPVELRYAWPAELDLMARLAGMALAERWESWDGRPFAAGSKQHISLYRL